MVAAAPHVSGRFGRFRWYVPWYRWWYHERLCAAWTMNSTWYYMLWLCNSFSISLSPTASALFGCLPTVQGLGVCCWMWQVVNVDLSHLHHATRCRWTIWPSEMRRFAPLKRCAHALQRNLRVLFAQQYWTSLTGFGMKNQKSKNDFFDRVHTESQHLLCDQHLKRTFTAMTQHVHHPVIPRLLTLCGLQTQQSETGHWPELLTLTYTLDRCAVTRATCVCSFCACRKPMWGLWPPRCRGAGCSLSSKAAQGYDDTDSHKVTQPCKVQRWQVNTQRALSIQASFCN